MTSVGGVDLTVLVVATVFCMRRSRAARLHDGIIIYPDDDVRENIIHYDEEGVGKTHDRHFNTRYHHCLPCSSVDSTALN